MKKFKFYQIIAAFACATCSINIYGMDAEAIQKALTATATTISGLASDAYMGFSNRTRGYADPLMKEIQGLNIDADQTKRNHRLEHAIDQLVDANDTPKLLQLIGIVNKHNAAHTNLTFIMSAKHKDKIQQPLHELYLKKHNDLDMRTKRDIASFLAETEINYESLVCSIDEEATTLLEMSNIIADAGGQKPDHKLVMDKLESLLAVKIEYTFKAALAKLLDERRKKLAAIALAGTASSTQTKIDDSANANKDKPSGSSTDQAGLTGAQLDNPAAQDQPKTDDSTNTGTNSDSSSTVITTTAITTTSTTTTPQTPPITASSSSSTTPATSTTSAPSILKNRTTSSNTSSLNITAASDDEENDKADDEDEGDANTKNKKKKKKNK